MVARYFEKKLIYQHWRNGSTAQIRLRTLLTLQICVAEIVVKKVFTRFSVQGGGDRRLEKNCARKIVEYISGKAYVEPI